MSFADEHGGTVEVEGTHLQFRRAGMGRAPLILLHGLTDDGACWDRVASTLLDAFDVVIPDARCHGRSGGIGADGFTVRRLAADVAGLMHRLDIRDALLFGHSMGAVTAALVAADRSDLVRALVLEDPPLDIPTRPGDVRRAGMVAEVEPWGRLDSATRHASARIAHPEWDPRETIPWADAKAAVDPTVFDHLDLFDDHDWRGVFDRLACPGLLVTGDPQLGAMVTDAVAAEATHHWRLGRRLHVEGAGHCIHRDRWDDAMPQIEAYLRSA